MGKNNRKPRERELSLEEQLRDLDANQPPGPLWFDGKLLPPSADRMAYVRRRQDIVSRIRRRQMKALTDPGPDPSGNYRPSPMAARGNVVEVAPKDLRSSATSDSFPKRVTTQRVIDTYRARGHIDDREWAAGNHLWELFVSAGAEFRVTSGYDPIFVQSSQDTDRIIARRVDAATWLNEIWANLPWRSKGCVRAVVIEDRWASDWARDRGYSKNQSRTHGLERLRLGLQGLADYFALDKAGVD